VGHAPGGDPPAGFDRVDENDELNVAFKGFQLGAVAAEPGLAAAQTKFTKPGFLFEAFCLLFSVLVEIHSLQNKISAP
jgi:hypothetical protein